MNRLTEAITEDLRVSTERYKECCDSHHFIEAAAIQEVIKMQKRYLRLARQEELRNQRTVSGEQVSSVRQIAFSTTRQGETLMNRYPSDTYDSVMANAQVSELKKK